MEFEVFKNERRFVVIILAAAFLLRIIGLSWGDPISDEGTNAFRSVGLIDFDAAAVQPTPWEWLDPALSAENTGLSSVLPWWARLSFHDHPLLTFSFEWLAMTVFGENMPAARLPSALLGVLSVYLIYLIGRRLFSVRAGLIAAAFMALSVNHVYVSRAGLQESAVIFFILWTLYLVIRAEESPKFLIWAGAILGLGLSAKYTAALALFIGLPYLAVKRPSYFARRELYLGAALALLFFTPSIIYNAMLYRVFGHFDFQISHILGNYPPAWSIAPGKEIGTFTDRLRVLPQNMLMTNSWLFLAALAASWIYLLVKGLRVWRRYVFLFLATASTLFLILKIGPSYRFLTMLFPWLALWVGVAGERVKAWRVAAIPIFLFEIFYTVNSQIMWYPVGTVPWSFSNVRYENYNWGYNELGEFFNREFKNKYPALAFDVKYKFLEELRDDAIERARARGDEPYPALIVYEGKFDVAAKLWNLDRLQIYHGWPLKPYSEFVELRRQFGEDYFDKLGFREYYLVVSGATVPMPDFNAFVADKKFVSILNKRGEGAFRVYRFN